MSVPPPGSRAVDVGVERGAIERVGERRDDVDLIVELHDREAIAIDQVVDERVEPGLDLVEPAVRRHRARVIDDDDEIERGPRVGRRIDRRVDRDLQRRLLRAGQPVVTDREPGHEAQHLAAIGGRRRGVVLVEEAVRVERVGPGDAAAVEDALELADVLGTAEADVAAAATSAAPRTRSCTRRGTGRDRSSVGA